MVPSPPLATPMLQLRKTKRCSQIFREVSGVFQQNFSGLKNCFYRAEDRAIFEDLRLRGQGLQNVSSRSSSRPRTSSRTPPLGITIPGTQSCKFQGGKMLVLGSCLSNVHKNPHLLSHLVSSHRCKS